MNQALRFSGLLRLFSFCLFWPGLALVVWGELFATGDGGFAIWDKALHFIAYGGLAGMAMLAFGNRRRVIWIVLALAVMGGALEIVQGYVGRDESLGDEFANFLGAISGGLTALWLLEFIGKAAPQPLQNAAKPGETDIH